MLEVEPDDIVIEESQIWVQGSEEKHDLAEIVDHAVNAHGEPISGTGRFVDQLPEGYTIPTAFAKNIPCFSFGTQAAEVEVDPETGQVQVLKVVAAHETGTTINQIMAEGQIEGSVAQGIGFALMEQLVCENGKVVNDRFLDYKIPNIGDMPEIEAICVESDGTNGPFGAKGIGEPGLVPTAPAIANAVYDAIGVRFHELPITRETGARGPEGTAGSEGAFTLIARGHARRSAGPGAPRAGGAGGRRRQDERPRPAGSRAGGRGRPGRGDDDDGHVPAASWPPSARW